MRPVTYCADIGSIPQGRFGWACSAADEDEAAIQRHQDGTQIIDLVVGVADHLAAGRGVALGFEGPVFVPVPQQPLRLGMARAGEGNRSWSAGVGAGTLATGIVQVAWIFSQLRRRCPQARPNAVVIGGFRFGSVRRPEVSTLGCHALARSSHRSYPACRIGSRSGC
jgi:hypothetical protein